MIENQTFMKLSYFFYKSSKMVKYFSITFLSIAKAKEESTKEQKEKIQETEWSHGRYFSWLHPGWCQEEVDWLKHQIESA